MNNDAKFAELNRLLALGDGVDTFGNTGDMRMGPNIAHYNQMKAQQTGVNLNASNGFGAQRPQQSSDNNPFFKV